MPASSPNNTIPPPPAPPQVRVVIYGELASYPGGEPRGRRWGWGSRVCSAHKRLPIPFPRAALRTHLWPELIYSLRVSSSGRRVMEIVDKTLPSMDRAVGPYNERAARTGSSISLFLVRKRITSTLTARCAVLYGSGVGGGQGTPGRTRHVAPSVPGAGRALACSVSPFRDAAGIGRSPPHPPPLEHLKDTRRRSLNERNFLLSQQEFPRVTVLGCLPLPRPCCQAMEAQ